MMRSIRIAVAALALVTASSASAQQGTDLPTLTVRTFVLQNISNMDATQLVAPYIQTRGGGVYGAGMNVRAVTVKETPAMLVRIDSVLRAHDHARVTLVLRFQLIEASDSAFHDSQIANLDATLRELFRFNGYHLLSQETAMVTEGEGFTLSMAGIGNERLPLIGSFREFNPGGSGSANMHVSLRHIPAAMALGAPGQTTEELLGSGITMTIGQTIVLGSTAYDRSGEGKVSTGHALILTVRPEIARGSKP